jgi:hypothetical protein
MRLDRHGRFFQFQKIQNVTAQDRVWMDWRWRFDPALV